MTGRTPFEYYDGEQFTTKEELEEYWARTVSGASSGFLAFLTALWLGSREMGWNLEDVPWP